MAAYAAFKHVELYNVGKTKKRVLRPPGGGTSDIFGGDLPQTPRSVKNHQQSNIFSCEKDMIKNNVRQGAHRFYFIGDQPRRAQKNVDSYQRLFGEPDRAATPAKNHMRSNIPFGAKTEAAQTLITNGNGHYNGKSGSVSSASSSVSSSTENLKMNGFSKTVYHRKMSNETSPELLNCEPIDQCPKTSVNCDSNRKGDDSARSKTQDKTNLSAGGDVGSQTRSDSGCNPNNPNSFTTNSLPFESQVITPQCVERSTSDQSSSRNPITGMGLNGDGVGGLKPMKPKCRRDGNPVTGEGYKTNDFNHTPSMNGANQVINKNRIPPGGFSSGLW